MMSKVCSPSRFDHSAAVDGDEVLSSMSCCQLADKLRAPGNRGVGQGVGLGCVHREAEEGATGVLGGD